MCVMLAYLELSEDDGCSLLHHGTGFCLFLLANCVGNRLFK